MELIGETGENKENSPALGVDDNVVVCELVVVVVVVFDEIASVEVKCILVVVGVVVEWELSTNKY